MRKTITLLSFVTMGLVGPLSLVAQDYTPSNWKFSEMELGTSSEIFCKPASTSKWGISAPVREADNMDGAIALAIAAGGDITDGGKDYDNLTDEQKQVFDQIVSNFQIIDGGELGHLLAYKGKNSTAEESRLATAEHSSPTMTMFFLSQTDLPLNQKYRLTFATRIVLNDEITAGSDLKFTIGTSHWDGIDNGAYREYNTKNYANFNDNWIQHVMDFEVQDNNDPNYRELPIMLKTFFGGNFDNMTFLLRDLKLERIDVVEHNPGISTIQTEWSDDLPTSIYDTVMGKGAIIWSNKGQINVIDAKYPVEVFDISGKLIKKQNTSGSLTSIDMEQSGLYIVKVGNQVQRVIL